MSGPASGAVAPTSAHVAYIGAGANLGQPERTLRQVIGELGQWPGIQLGARSSLYRTAPMAGTRPATAADGAAQPDYFNAVVRVQTTLPPADLLAALLAVEQRHGRVRSVPNAPRSLDLDLLLYDDRIVQAPGLAVPHPRMHLRRFVLEPLLEIAPACIIPGIGPASEWHTRVLDQPVEKVQD